MPVMNVPSSKAAQTGYGHESANWILIGLVMAVMVPLQLYDPFSLAPKSLMIPAIFCVILHFVSKFYRYVRNRADLAAMFIAIMHMILFTALGSALSYMLAARGGTLWDGTYQKWDLALGFNWLNYLHWVDQYPLLVKIYSLAYQSLIPQIIILVCGLGFTGRVRQMRASIFAAMLCGLVIILISPFMAAVSNFVFLNIEPGEFANINPSAGWVHLDHFCGLRNGSLRMIDITTAEGIITFPSYHAGLAMVTLCGFWSIPGLRVVGVPIAVLTILATPVDGGHYLVDVIAGGLIAVLSVIAAKYAVGFNSARWFNRFNRLPIGQSPQLQ